MENNMKYMKLFEEWDGNINFTDDVEKAYKEIISGIDFSKTHATVNIEDYTIHNIDMEDATSGDTSAYVTLEHSGVLVLDSKFNCNDWMGFCDSFDYNEWYISVYTERFGTVRVEKDYPCDILKVDGDQIYVDSFICDGHSTFKDPVGEIRGVETNFILKNCPMVKNIGGMNFFEATDTIEVFDVSNCNILELWDVPDLDIFYTFDCSGNCLLYGCPSISSENNNGSGVYIKVDDNPWLEDPEVEGYEWDLEESLNVLEFRLEEKKITPQEVYDALNQNNRLTLLIREDKISDGAAKILWNIIDTYFPERLEDYIIKCKAVGNWIPPDFLARMKRYDHSEYRDSKLDSEWKEVF